jgi:cathepsin D
MGGVAVKGITFGEMDKMNGVSWIAGKFDGILGMAWIGISADSIPPVFESMYEQGLIDDNSFSFYLTSAPGAAGSKLVLGGVDSTLYTGEFSYHTLMSDTYWEITVDDLTVGGKKQGFSGVKGVVDSGTSLLVGDTKFMNKIIDEIGAVKADCSNIASLPEISFVINGQDYTLSANDYVLKITSGGQTECMLGIQAMTLPAHLEGVVIMGDIFIRKYYTHFDYANNRVGFALAN